MTTQHTLPRIEVKDLSQPTPRKKRVEKVKFKPNSGHKKHDVVALALEVIAAGSWYGIGEANGYASRAVFRNTILQSSRVAIALSPQQIAALERAR